ARGLVPAYASGSAVGPLPAEPRPRFILGIFAARVAAEFERLRAEQRLQESEARYRDLYENAPNPYWIVGTDGRILSANRPFAELTGYAVEELVGIETHTLVPATPAAKPRLPEVR